MEGSMRLGSGAAGDTSEPARGTGPVPGGAAVTHTVEFELFTSSFCGACLHTRSVLTRAAGLVPGAVMLEHDVALEPGVAESAGITATPTVIVRDREGREVLRASGVPTLDQVLAAAAKALPPREG